jgi:hypothetical protein
MRKSISRWVQQQMSAACFLSVDVLRHFEAKWRTPMLYLGFLENKFSIQGAFNFAVIISQTEDPRWAHRWPDTMIDFAVQATEDSTLLPLMVKLCDEYVSEYLKIGKASPRLSYETYRILQGFLSKASYR